MASFDKLTTVTASTKRSPAVSAGKRGTPVTYIASLQCTPLDPVSAELAQRVGLDTPHLLRQTYAEAVDIREGDVLVVSSVEYPIRAAGEWEWRGTNYKHLVVEVLKQ